MTEAAAADSGTSWKRLGWLALRISVTAAALIWTVTRVSLDDMLQAASRIGVGALAAAVAIGCSNLFVGALRWKVMLIAYGAKRPPSVLHLARVYFVSLFYNTFLPGNVGGDVLRGHVTRSAFDGASAAYVVVFVERLFGLAGLLLLGATVLSVHPVGGVDLPLVAGGAAIAAAGAALFPLVGRRLAPILPGILGRIAASFPAVERPALLLVVLLLSCCTQLVVALTGHVLVHAVDPEIPLADSLVLVPVALIALYFPAAVAGIGVREAAFVFLFTGVGMAAADATAASLAFLATTLVVALFGGLSHVVFPLSQGGPRDSGE